MVEEAHKDYLDEEKTLIRISKVHILGMALVAWKVTVPGNIIGHITGEPFNFSVKNSVKNYINNLRPHTNDELKEIAKRLLAEDRDAGSQKSETK